MNEKIRAQFELVCGVMKLVALIALTVLVSMAIFYIGFLFYFHLASGKLLVDDGFKVSDLINLVLVVISLGLAYLGFKIAKDAADIAKNANKLAKQVADNAQEHNAQSIRPALNCEINKTSLCGFKIIITNAGLGPAFINCVDVYLNECRLSDELDGVNFFNTFEVLTHQAVEEYGAIITDIHYESPSIGKGSVIGTGQSFEWSFYLNHREVKNITAYEAIAERFLFFIGYEDSYRNYFEESVGLK